jgi:hypothetical protein
MLPHIHIIEIVIGESGILVGSIVAFALHGSWLWWYRRVSRTHLAAARAALTAALGAASPAPHELHLPLNLSTRLRIRLLVELARNLDGVGRQQLTALASGLGLVTRAEKYCRSRFWWRRLEGARLFTLFGTGEMVVPALLQDRRVIVRTQAAEWAADHPTPDVISALLPLLGDEATLSRFTVQDSLARMGRPVVEPLADYIATHSGAAVEGGLKVAAGLGDPRLLGPALQRCRDREAPVRALAAHLIGTLGGQEGVDMLLSLLHDQAAPVRAAAARALGRLNHWPAATHLVALLRDPFYIVRREAGLALRALGAPGILFLRHSLDDEDQFAADMARQVLDLPDMAEWAIAI